MRLKEWNDSQKNITVTGSDGYIASNLIPRLRVSPNIENIVFHLFGTSDVLSSFVNPWLDLKINFKAMMEVLKLGKKIVFPSSVSVYGNCEYANENTPPHPESPYAIHKLMCECYIANSGLDYVILRIGSVWGRNAKRGLIKALQNGKKIRGDGKVIRDFVFIDDVVEALAECPNWESGIYNLGSGRPLSVNQVADRLGVKKEYGAKVKEPRQMTMDIAKILKTGWKPTKFI